MNENHSSSSSFACRWWRRLAHNCYLCCEGGRTEGDNTTTTTNTISTTTTRLLQSLLLQQANKLGPRTPKRRLARQVPVQSGAKQQASQGLGIRRGGIRGGQIAWWAGASVPSPSTVPFLSPDGSLTLTLRKRPYPTLLLLQPAVLPSLFATRPASLSVFLSWLLFSLSVTLLLSLYVEL